MPEFIKNAWVVVGHDFRAGEKRGENSQEGRLRKGRRK